MDTVSSGTRGEWEESALSKPKEKKCVNSHCQLRSFILYVCRDIFLFLENLFAICKNIFIVPVESLLYIALKGGPALSKLNSRQCSRGRKFPDTNFNGMASTL